MAEQIKNEPSVTVNEVVNILSNSYIKLINNGVEFKKFPSVMLWGSPGLGKSQAVKQIAKEIEDETHKKVFVTDVRLMLFNPVDLRGIPTSNADKTLAVWLKPKIFDMNPSNDVVNILFLDELSAAPQSVQSAAYQITLDRIIGEHKLPENCIVIAAGNRVTDKSVAYKMPKALANRLLHFEVVADFRAWRAWAVKNNINEKVVSFLSFRSDYLIDESNSNDNLAFATPRAWEMVSNVLNYVSDDISQMYDVIAGIVGKGMAVELKAWDKISNSLPNVDDILNGRSVKIPNQTDQLYALVSAVVKRTSDYTSSIDKLNNVVNFALNLPGDFSSMLMVDITCLNKNMKSTLIKIPSYARWLNTKGRILNGLVK